MKVGGFFLRIFLVLPQFSCSRNSTSNREKGDSCEQRSTSTGVGALSEMNEMISVVPLGSRCHWEETTPDGVYNLTATEGQTLSLKFSPDGSPKDSQLSTNRVACGGVPYWLSESTAAFVNGSPATFSWKVREDTRETANFALHSEEGKLLINSETCK